MGIPMMARQPFEEITTITLLGIRFWDPVQDRQIGDSLTITAQPEKGDGPITESFRTASGVYAFQGLAGMHDYEAGHRKLETSPLEKRCYLIEVRDRQRRFLPMVFKVDLPLPNQGIFPMALNGEFPGADNLPGCFLFSAPTRPVTPGLAAVRAQLVNQSTRQPAGHAIMRIRVSETDWYGIADERGRILVQFPYPTMNVRQAASPPNLLLSPLRHRQWHLTIQVCYERGALLPLQGSDLPDLRSIFGQSPGLIWPTTDAPVADWFCDLTFGKELILRTEGTSESELWIDAGTSPL